jgi:N-6 DNA Methylase
LVDFILDHVLPWNGNKWDLKILDPACGSGIFLVKAFQRLIHRWKSSHPKEDIRADTLRTILEKNLFGIDKDSHAVRVASFSLYLAMCDEIDPKYYWTQVHFPRMRQRRLITADFFEESHSGFCTDKDNATYDLVIGNAPWGEELLTRAAKDWASDKTRQWPVANKGIGTLFLPKAAALTKPTGRVSMIQSASSLLFNRSGPACEFRKKFFTAFCVTQVVNLSALRFKVFNQKTRSTQKSVAPPCIVTFSPERPSNDSFGYISPKQADDFTDEFDLIIEPADRKALHSSDAADNSEIWTALMWGNRRDWNLVQRLQTQPNLERLRRDNKVTVREGIIPSAKGKLHPGTRERLFWDGESFPDGTFLRLRTDNLERTGGLKTHRRTALDAFALPQLTIKQGWQESAERFIAALTPSKLEEGVLFTQSYLSVHLADAEENLLEAACLSYNSMLAVYFLLLTSSRFASYRPEPLVEELLRVPIPTPRPKLLEGMRQYEDVDRRIRDAFGFKDAEWVLIEDLFNVTLADFKGGETSPGRLRTRRKVGIGDEPDLRRYCEHFIRVLKAGFGSDKQITATIFQENGSGRLPYRLTAFHLKKKGGELIRVQALDAPELLKELETLNKTWLGQRNPRAGSIYSRRIVRVYDDSGGSPTIYILKPDAYRYWTRSMGLRDADEVAADFSRWNAQAKRAAATYEWT